MSKMLCTNGFVSLVLKIFRVSEPILKEKILQVSKYLKFQNLK